MWRSNPRHLRKPLPCLQIRKKYDNYTVRREYGPAGRLGYSKHICIHARLLIAIIVLSLTAAAPALAGESIGRQRELSLMDTPDKICRDPDVIQHFVNEVNASPKFSGIDLQIMDVREMRTVKVHIRNEFVACHGVFVFNQFEQGRQLQIGATVTDRISFAGRLIWEWVPDNNDGSLGDYDKPP